MVALKLGGNHQCVDRLVFVHFQWRPELYKNCSKNCALPCFEDRFRITMSTSEWPSSSQLEEFYYKFINGSFRFTSNFCKEIPLIVAGLRFVLRENISLEFCHPDVGQFTSVYQPQNRTVLQLKPNFRTRQKC